MAAVFFVMLLTVQIAFLVVTRSTVGAAVDAATRDAARDDPRALDVHEDRLAERVTTAAPTAIIRSVELARSGDEVSARVVLRWVPPGPDLVPVTMTVESRRSVAVPP